MWDARAGLRVLEETSTAVQCRSQKLTDSSENGAQNTRRKDWSIVADSGIRKENLATSKRD